MQVRLRAPIGKPTVLLYAPLPPAEQPSPETRAAELVAREDAAEVRLLERWLHETWDFCAPGGSARTTDEQISASSAAHLCGPVLARRALRGRGRGAH